MKKIAITEIKTVEFIGDTFEHAVFDRSSDRVFDLTDPNARISEKAMMNIERLTPVHICENTRHGINEVKLCWTQQVQDVLGVPITIINDLNNDNQILLQQKNDVAREFDLYKSRIKNMSLLGRLKFIIKGVEK